MTSKSRGRVDLDRMRGEYDKFRARIQSGPTRGQVTIRAVADIIEDVHLEGKVRGSRLESDEPEERGGTGKAMAPLSYFLIGAAF